MSNYSENAYFNTNGNTKTAAGPIDTTPIPAGTIHRFIRTQATGDKVYYVLGEEAHWVKNPETLAALGGGFDKIVGIKNDEFKTLNTRVESISMSNVDRYKIEVVEAVVEAQATPEVVPESPEAIKDAMPIEKGKTSIIILAHFNSYAIFHHTGNCIGSIREHTDKTKTPYEIILVINGKTAIEFGNLQDSKADKVIINEENEGYSKAVNKAIRMSSGEYIALVNNDTMEFDHWLEDMQDALQHGLALVMATPMYGEPYGRAVEAGLRRETTMAGDITTTYSDFTDFACVLTTKELFKQIGVFDERFFLYCEDLDLMRRIKKAGLKYASTKRVNIFHIIGGTGGENIAEEMNKSKALLKSIWGY